MEPVDIEVPGLQIMKYQDCCSLLPEAEELMTGIIVGGRGELNGLFLFLLDETFTRAVSYTHLDVYKRQIFHICT